MGQTTHDTDTLPIAEVADRLSNLVDEVSANDKRIVIERDGVPVATIISMSDLHMLRHVDDEIKRRWQLLEMMREPFRDVPPEEIERETAKAVAEVRAEMKAKRLQEAKIA
jgi:PHD/YefM family antitoxin component YafN of YafNO toxin-antitoxin module